MHPLIFTQTPTCIHTHIQQLYIKVKTTLWEKVLNFFQLVCLLWFSFMEKERNFIGAEIVSQEQNADEIRLKRMSPRYMIECHCGKWERALSTEIIQTWRADALGQATRELTDVLQEEHL